MSESEKSTSAWDDLIYDMFYPSILGSVVFDYMDPVRFSLENIDRLFLLPGLLAFVIDYWHMKNNVRAHEGSTLWFRVLDIGLILLFLVSYYTFSYALTKEQATGSLPAQYAALLLRGFLMISFALVFVVVYDYFRFGRSILTRVKRSLIVLSVLVTIAWIVHAKIAPEMTPLWFRCSSFVMPVLYFIYVATWPKPASQSS